MSVSAASAWTATVPVRLLTEMDVTALVAVSGLAKVQPI
jgi:hypothetical protein